MSGYYPGYPNPSGGAPHQQQPFYSPDQQHRAGPAYNPPPPHSRPPPQPGMGFTPPPGPPMNHGFNPLPPAQSSMISPTPLGMGLTQAGKGFQPPSAGTPGVAPPPMYSLNAAMKEMSVSVPGIASSVPGGYVSFEI